MSQEIPRMVQHVFNVFRGAGHGSLKDREVPVRLTFDVVPAEPNRDDWEWQLEPTYEAWPLEWAREEMTDSEREDAITSAVEAFEDKLDDPMAFT